MFYDDLTTDEQIEYLLKPILKTLQKAGGQLERPVIRATICNEDEHIAEFEQKLYTSKKTGKQYKKFDFKFNFAIKELSFVDLVSYEKYNPKVTLTEKGRNIELNNLDVKEITAKAKVCWGELSAKNQNQKQASSQTNLPLEQEEENTPSEDTIMTDFTLELEEAIKKMSPKKFESFSRALLTKMGIQFTDIGIQLSNDGGVDGYGYHIDEKDFRTTRVVIQCKRFNTAPVGEPNINQFLGAMNKFQADYGVFITNSRFTTSARAAARQGTPVTLIDGNDLIRLVIKYQLYITPVTTYVLDDFYYQE